MIRTEAFCLETIETPKSWLCNMKTPNPWLEVLESQKNSGSKLLSINPLTKNIVIIKSPDWKCAFFSIICFRIPITYEIEILDVCSTGVFCISWCPHARLVVVGLCFRARLIFFLVGWTVFESDLDIFEQNLVRQVQRESGTKRITLSANDT